MSVKLLVGNICVCFNSIYLLRNSPGFIQVFFGMCLVSLCPKWKEEMVIVYIQSRMENYIFCKEMRYFKITLQMTVGIGEGVIFGLRANRRILFFVSDPFCRCDLLVLTSDVRMSV